MRYWRRPSYRLATSFLFLAALCENNPYLAMKSRKDESPCQSDLVDFMPVAALWRQACKESSVMDIIRGTISVVTGTAVTLALCLYDAAVALLSVPLITSILVSFALIAPDPMKSRRQRILRG